MEFLKKAALILFIALLAFVSLWVVFSPKDSLNQRIAQTLQKQKEKADLLFRGVTFSEIDNGIKYWELNAKESILNNDLGFAKLKEVDGTFFQKGKPSLNFIAPSADWNMKDKEISLEKPIGFDANSNIKPNQIAAYLAKIPNAQNLSVFSMRNKYISGMGNIYWFKANVLNWKMANQKILCRGGIILNKGDISIQANALEGDVALEKAKLTGSPFAEILPNSNKTQKTHIDAEEFTLDSKKGSVIARHKVIIDHQDHLLPYKNLKITCQAADYNQNSQTLNLQTTVEAYYGDIYACGEYAHFSRAKQLVQLSGKAYAIYKGGRINGETVNVLLDKKTVTVTGKSKVIVKKELIIK